MVVIHLCNRDLRNLVWQPDWAVSPGEVLAEAWIDRYPRRQPVERDRGFGMKMSRYCPHSLTVAQDMPSATCTAPSLLVVAEAYASVSSHNGDELVATERLRRRSSQSEESRRRRAHLKNHAPERPR
jgi:hypothetical protein